MSAVLGGLAFTPLSASARGAGPVRTKQPASAMAAVFGASREVVSRDAAMLRACAEKTGVTLNLENSPVDAATAETLAVRVAESRPDGLTLVVADAAGLRMATPVIEAVEKLRGSMVPVVLHPADPALSVDGFQRPGLFVVRPGEAERDLTFGFRMMHVRSLLRQSVLLGFDNKPASEAVLPFFGVKLRMIPFARYAADFEKISLGGEARAWMSEISGKAIERRGITDSSLENAARAHFALKKILAEEQADGLSMNCLRSGFLKPCMSFASFNGDLVPAACEMDIPALCTLLVARHLIGRPGFMHNSAYETEKNHYYASHCTCTPKLRGPDKPDLPYLIRRFMHTNEGSCAIQTFWEKDDPVTMVRATPGSPAQMDVYAGRVILSHPMPPAGGCATNVEIKLTDRDDAMMVQGHHNVLFFGDHARDFRAFARFFRLQMVNSGYRESAPA